MVIQMRSKMQENEKWIYPYFSFLNSSRGQMLKFTCSKIQFFHEINVFGSNSNSIPGSVQNQVGFAIDNCSDPYRIQKMHVFWSDLPPGSVQNDARKWWNMWKSVKIIEKFDENLLWVPYKNRRKMQFWARPGNTLQKNVIFTFGTLLITSR